MNDKTKYIDAKKIFANKEKISATVPQYIYEDLKAYTNLTGLNTTDIITDALFKYFKDKTVTNNDLLGYGNLFFKLPLSKSYKSNAIANKIKLNSDLETSEETETITITTVTNNLDVFDGNTYYAGSELEKENIKHIGLDFAIIPTALKPTDIIKNNELDINVNDALYVFYYEVTSMDKIDVYLINPIDAVNKLASAKSIKANEKLVSCLQELETIQTEINKKYSEEMQEIHKNNNYVSGDKKQNVKDKYTAIIIDVLTDVANKYNTGNIKIGSDATTYNLKYLDSLIKHHETEQENYKKIIEMQEQEKEL